MVFIFILVGIAEQRRLRNGGRGEDRQHGKAPEQHRGSKNRVQPKGKQCGGKSGAKPRYRQRAAERSKLLIDWSMGAPPEVEPSGEGVGRLDSEGRPAEDSDGEEGRRHPRRHGGTLMTDRTQTHFWLSEL